MVQLNNILVKENYNAYQRNWYKKNKQRILLKSHNHMLERRKNGYLKCKICGKNILDISRRRYCSDKCAEKGELIASKKSKKKYYNSFYGRYSIYKRNALTKKRDFNLTFTQFKTIVQQPCHYCGNIDKPFNGIDKVDNSKGYEIKNCVSCCKMCNQMKHKFEKNIFIKRCKKIAENNNVE